MNRKSFTWPNAITPFLLIATSCCVLSSCSSSAQLITDEEHVTFPEEFEEDGTKWTRSTTASDSDLKRLSEFFRKNSSIAEGSLISGTPTLYTSSKGTKRFYWGRPGIDEPEWIHVEFEGRKVNVEEGTGAPIGTPST